MYNVDKIAKNILVGRTCSECISFSGFTTSKCKKITIEENKVDKNYSCVLWDSKGSVLSQDEIDELLTAALKNPISEKYEKQGSYIDSLTAKEIQEYRDELERK